MNYLPLGGLFQNIALIEVGQNVEACIKTYQWDGLGPGPGPGWGCPSLVLSLDGIAECCTSQKVDV